MNSIGRVLRRRRTLFNVPGSDERKLKSPLKLVADSIVLDLEDGVAWNRKLQARQLVAQALKCPESVFGHSKAERAVRINSVGSGMELDDLRAILSDKSSSANLHAIVIPKTECAAHVEFLNSVISTVAPERLGQIRLLPAIESAKALANINEIASGDNVDALVFASEDYCADTGIQRSDSLLELLYARSAVVNAAKARELQAIDLVCIDYRSQDRLRHECLDGKRMGFTGKQAIHPSQLDLINQTFIPSDKEIEHAQRVLDGYKRHADGKGVGAFVIDGKMIDMPIVKAAIKVLSAAGIV